MDPPEYTPSAPLMPTSTRRSIEDTRALILHNASIIKPRNKLDGAVELIVGKVNPSRHPEPTTSHRSFTSTRSNVTIRVEDPPGPSTSNTTSTEQPSASTAPVREVGKHYAALVCRGSSSADIQVLLVGEPQDNIENALEWLLDRTEVVVTEMLSRHKKRVWAGCCVNCDQIFDPRRYSSS